MNTQIFQYTREVFNLLKRVVERPGEYNPVYIYGKSGSGKTSIINAIFGDSSDAYILKPSTISKGDLPLIEGVKYIVIEDIDLITFSKDALKKFLLAFEEWIDSKIQIIITGTDGPDLIDIPERIVSLIRGGLVVSIKPLNDEDRREIIEKLFPELPDERKAKVIGSGAQTIRELIGYVKNLEMVGEKEEEGSGLAGDQFRELVKSLEEDMPQLTKERSIEEELREEYRAKLYVWEMKGFKCDRLKKVIDGPIEDITREFVSFTTDVQRLVELQRRYGLLDPSLITSEKRKEIEESLFDPDRIFELDRIIGQLERRLELKRDFVRFINLEKGIDAIVVGEGNKEVMAFINSFLKKEIPWEGVYVIAGDRGYGKSIHLNALSVELIRKYPEVVVGFTGMSGFVSAPDVMLAKLSECDLMFIDDADRILNRFNIDLKSFINKNRDRCIILTLRNVLREFSIEDERIFRLGEPDLGVKKAMLEEILEMGDYNKSVDYLSGLSQVKGGFYEVEFYVNTMSKREHVEIVPEVREVPFEETTEVHKEETIEEIPVEKEDVEKVVTFEEETTEGESKLEEYVEKAEKEEKPVEKVEEKDSELEGYSVDISNISLRIVKEL